MFLPYKVDVPMARWPIANWVLIGLTVIISGAMFGPLERWTPPGLRDSSELSQLLGQSDPAADRLVDAFLLQPGNFHVTQLVGNLFIHAGWLHLIGNMVFLWVFGNAVNAKLGHGKFILLYLGVGVTESTLWMIVGPGQPCLGASGAIMGIIGGFLLLYPLNDVSILYMFTLFYRGVFELSAMWVIALYVAFDLWGLMSEKQAGVAYLAHVAGFLSGALLTAAILKIKMVEMDRGEKSLLQVWKLMPHEDDVSPHDRQAAALASVYGTGAKRAVPPAAGPVGGTGGSAPRIAAPPPPRKKRDEGPIPLD